MHSLLFQVNSRCSLRELEGLLKRPATFDDVPDEWIDNWVRLGIEWVWFLGVWQTGPESLRKARSLSGLRKSYGALLGGLEDEDVQSSPFAIERYQVARELGGPDCLARLRRRLSERGIRLVLDFVPNHVGIDHPWAFEHPEWFVSGTEADLLREPLNFTKVSTVHGERILAYGRDPNFSGWWDTLQLDYAHEGCRKAVLDELLRIADHCDGLRCDMAMLLEPEVFERTWGKRRTLPDGSPSALRRFWPEAIERVKRTRPDFLFIAEVYWEMEWALQQQGFDYTYDKRLYDRLKNRQARPVREHLMAEPSFQARSLRFLENHDEPRAASTFPWAVHRAALAITLLVPGMALLHDGQLEGRGVQIPMQVRVRPDEPSDPLIRSFYESLLACTRRQEVRRGIWSLWPCRPAWEGNGTWDQFIVSSWSLGERALVVVINYGPTRAQCYARAGLTGLRGRRFVLRDLLTDATYERDGDALAGPGLYLDATAWGVHAFMMEPE